MRSKFISNNVAAIIFSSDLSHEEVARKYMPCPTLIGTCGILSVAWKRIELLTDRTPTSFMDKETVMQFRASETGVKFIKGKNPMLVLVSRQHGSTFLKEPMYGIEAQLFYKDEDNTVVFDTKNKNFNVAASKCIAGVSHELF